MERYTMRTREGLITASEGHCAAEFPERLALWEDFYTSLQEEEYRINMDMKELKLAGRSKSVSYRQLVGQKLKLKEFLFRIGKSIESIEVK